MVLLRLDLETACVMLLQTCSACENAQLKVTTGATQVKTRRHFLKFFNGTHLYVLTVEEENIRFLLIGALAHEEEEGWEALLRVDGLAA